MSPKSLLQNQDFIQLTSAVKLVPYTRDYIGRLAREGKIVSQQIDKQWFVEKKSLLNFFEQSTLEDSIRKRILSVHRKNDLLVKDVHVASLEKISQKMYQAPLASFVLTLAIMSSGLFSGLFLYASTEKNSIDETGSHVLAALNLLQPAQNTANVMKGSDGTANFFSDTMVVETQEEIMMGQGIVLFPAGADTGTEYDFFSDDVSVTVTSTTTGLIRLSNQNRELPFVRIPRSTDI